MKDGGNLSISYSTRQSSTNMKDSSSSCLKPRVKKLREILFVTCNFQKQVWYIHWEELLTFLSHWAALRYLCIKTYAVGTDILNCSVLSIILSCMIWKKNVFSYILNIEQSILIAAIMRPEIYHFKNLLPCIGFVRNQHKILHQWSMNFLILAC